MDEELDLARYIDGLKRSARWIVAVALLGAMGGLALGLTQPDQVSMTLRPVSRGAELRVAGVDLEDIDLVGTIESLVSELSTDVFQAEISEMIGGSVDVEASIRPGVSDDTIDLVVAAPDEEAANAATNAVVARSRTFFDSDLSAAISGVRVDAQTRLDNAKLRVEELDTAIAAGTNDQEFLLEGLLAQRLGVRSEVAAVETQVAALEAYEAGLASDLRVFGRSDAKPARGPAILVFVGLVVAAILGGLAALARTAIDRTIRSRRDLRRIGLESVVGVIGARPNTNQTASLAAALRHASHSFEHPNVQIVVVGDSPARLEWIDDVSAQLGSDPSCALAAGVGEATLRIAADSASVISVLAIEWGKCHRASAASAANRLLAAGSSDVGVILFGVPNRELKSVES